MILGIDFGTSKSAVAVMEAGKPRIITDLLGHRTMPSLVMVAPDERIYIGWEALTHHSRYESAHWTIGSIKRLLGRTGETTWGRFRTHPQEVSALILGRLRILAEAWYDREISKAVVAVPAHFDINQRWATMQAAEIAGFEVLRLINEATAAVLARHGIRKGAEGTAVVFDWGGGTLDISIVQFSEGVYEVRATWGDDRLGGDDFDQIIVDYLLEHSKARFGSSLELNRMQQLFLKEAATRAKIELSSASTARVHIPGFLHSVSEHYDLDVYLDRSTFLSLCSELFKRSEAGLRNALSDARIPLGGLTDVLLIGGTSRIPYIRDLVCKITGLQPASLDSEVGVAEGASIVAGTLGGEVAGVLLLDVVPSGYSMAVERDMATTMISRNTTIPTRKSGVFTTVEDNQTQLTVRVLQGEESVASQNTLVGEVHLSGLPPAPRGVPQIEVAFEISVDNTLTVSARDRDTGREVRSRLEAPYRLNSAQINVLQRKVEQELQTLRRRELDARKREREEMTRNRATTLAKKVERFLAVQRASVGADEASLLDAQREVVVPLLKTLADESVVVRRVALTTLEGCRDLMVPDLRKFFELAQRVIGQGASVTLRQKVFLRKVVKKYRELDEVVDVLKEKK